jgi:hypothetical protein
MSKFDLAKAIYAKIEAVGNDKAAAFFGRTVATMAKWKNGSAVPDIASAQKVLDEALNKEDVPPELDSPAFEGGAPRQGKTMPKRREEIAEDAKAQVGGQVAKQIERAPAVKPLEVMERATKYDILLPVNRLMHDAVVSSLIANWKTTLPKEIRHLLSQFHVQRDTVIHRARNLLATRFLESKNEWSVWFDSDIIAPTGNHRWFQAQTRAKWKEVHQDSALEHLTTTGKTFVGGVYAERGEGDKLIFAQGMKEKPTAEDKRLIMDIRKGPVKKLIQVPWVGFGCVAVHRKVFEDILEKVEGVKSKDKEAHGFFTAFVDGPKGEDVAFAKRAAEAGHPCYLDLAIHCGHLGNKAYMP